MLVFMDKILRSAQNNTPVPLDGHTKIIFTDVATGKERVVADKHNMVTQAVGTVLNNNYGSLLQLSSIMPLYSLFSGVLCFQEDITESATNINPPNDVDNPLVAHAGQSMNDTASRLRGNPVVSDIVITDTSIKFVWSWDSSHGNGTIRSVCLCPDALGNMGLKPYDDTLNVFVNIAQNNNIGAGSSTTKDRTFAMKFPCSISSDGQTGKAIWWSGTTFEEITVRHDWLKFGIMRTTLDWQEVSSRSATVRATTSRKATFFQDDSYYYCMEVTGATSIQVDKIAKSDFSVTTSDITLSGTSLYTGNLWLDYWNRLVPQYPFDGTNLYILKSDKLGFYRIPLSNVADVEELTSHLTSVVDPAANGFKSGGAPAPIVIGEGLVIGNGYFINGNDVYHVGPMSRLFSSSNDYNDRFRYSFIRNGPSVYGISIQDTTGNFITGQGPALLGTFLSTINVLDEAATKDNTVSMRIEYTITEV